jgi:hypothetical protein
MAQRSQGRKLKPAEKIPSLVAQNQENECEKARQ